MDLQRLHRASLVGTAVFLFLTFLLLIHIGPWFSLLAGFVVGWIHEEIWEKFL